MFKAAAVWNEKLFFFSWLDLKPSTNQHTTVHTQVWFLHETTCSVLKIRHSAEMDCTIVSVRQPGKHTTHSVFNKREAGPALP